jgi:uncharacterized RDD family membrane protein YckC
MNPPFGSDPDATQPIPVTPAPPPPRPRVAPPVPRFGNVPVYLVCRFLAFVIDVAAVAFALAAFGFNAFERGFVTLAGRDEGGFAALAAVSFGAALAFAFVCESLFGTTLGKATFGLRTSRGDGRHANVLRIFVRYLLRPVDLVLVGPLLALVTPRHQRLGDFLGGTVVARTRFAPLASVVGIALLAGLAYAQIAFGGGLDSVLGVSAEAANFGPDLVAKTAALAGITVQHSPVVPMPPLAGPSALPSPAPSPAPAAEDPESPEPSDAEHI